MCRVGGEDWFEWHRPYEVPGSALRARLALVQDLLRRALESAPDGPIRLVSGCAGQGLDVLGVLPDHPRRFDVTARLVELDPRNAVVARRLADEAGLTNVEIVTGDASLSDAYGESATADVVLMCGIFGNLRLADIRRTVAFLPRLCAPAASVIWTRHRRPPDRTGEVRTLFARAGFTELAFEAPPDHEFVGVGFDRFDGEPLPFRAGVRLFDFVGRGDAAPLHG